MEAAAEFSPAIPFPEPFDVQKRIQELRGYLDPKNPHYQPEQQHTNIKAAIKLYEDGKINGEEEIFIMDGKLVPEKEIYTGKSWAWSEGGDYYQFVQARKNAYGHGPFGTSFHEVSIGFFFLRFGIKNSLQIRMLLRLIPAYGGDGTVHRIIAMNDTGSNVLSLFTTDLQQLGNMQGYTGWGPTRSIKDAHGVATPFRTIRVQVQLVKNDNTPWGSWIDELALVRSPTPNLARLSGCGIRRVLYIGTAPSNHLLAIADTKGGMTSLL
jgi:hypothetical protein